MTTYNNPMKKLLSFFNEQNHLLVFALNGSQINPNIPDDKFKDYDVVFFTDDLAKYKENDEFLKKFGDILIQTEPDGEGNMGGLLYPDHDGYTYLVQYKHGLRIDFQFQHISRLGNFLKTDSLTKIVASKQPLPFDIEIPTDQSYWEEKPTDVEVFYSIKEFWWQALNVLKSVLRGDYLLSQSYLNLVRDELISVITWNISFNQGFCQNYGKKKDKIFQFLSKEDKLDLQTSFNTVTFDDVVIALSKLLWLEKKYTELLLVRKEYNHLDMSSYDKTPYYYLVSKEEYDLAERFKF